MIDRVRLVKPIVHCITNYVTAGDVANMVLAAGASPIMADGVKEMEDIAGISHGLVLNLGTLKENAVEAMLIAGKRTAGSGHPVVLDPVGAAAASFRRETALKIIKEVPCTVIRGNASEIRALAGAVLEREETVSSRGVDTDRKASMNNENRQSTVSMAQGLSRATGAIVVMTGETDLVADADRTCLVKNGCPMMSRITGSGCMLDGIIASFLAAEAAPEAGGVPAAGADRRSCTGAHAAPGADGRAYADRREESGAGSRLCAGIQAAPEAGGVPAAEAGRAERMFWQTAYAVAAEGICGELAYEKTMRAGGGTATFRMHFIDAMSLLTDEDIRRMSKIEA